ncbi:MAG: ABC transporter ATP-binding protein [Candidatus Omnitrophica bacterium]|jgi:cobalt/nickel transport system ATP-binding protein|nr:ABC transporter ATP-binding protein [Candidatus Omnitrophota bacterium]MDD5725432.1 ABC transporter ATP-binding protein [Candidatus Omnitrophota bacterium]
MDSVIFKANGVSYSYPGGLRALFRVDAAVNRGEKVGIIGANGSGKSTFLQLLDGLIFAESGEVSFCGRRLSEKEFEDPVFSAGFRRRVGFVFQNSEIQLFCPTAKEDILFGPLQLGLPREDTLRRVDRLVEILRIGNLLERAPYRLSIGEKRKIAIVSVLAINPEVLILDEPTAGLDPATSRSIIDLLLAENRAGKTIITATQDLHIVEEISDRVYVFGGEKTVVKSGTPEVILEDTSLLGANNLLHVHSHRHQGKAHVHPHAGIEHHLDDLG